jgi:hypothetical protein
VIVKALATLFVSALAVVGVAGAAADPTTYKLTATLTAGAEPKPKPTGVKSSGTGTFSGTAVVPPGPYARTVLKWKLTFAKLTGPRRYAYLHRFKPDGTAGKVLIRLCMPCRNGHRGRSTPSDQYLKLILAGKAFVGVYTVWGEASEIRGKLKAVEAAP